VTIDYACIYVHVCTNYARVSSRRFVGSRVGNETTLEITSTFYSSADTMTRSRALASPRGSPRGVVGEHTCRVNRHLSFSMGNSVRAKAASLTSLGAFSSFSYCCGFRAAFTPLRLLFPRNGVRVYVQTMDAKLLISQLAGRLIKIPGSPLGWGDDSVARFNED